MTATTILFTTAGFALAADGRLCAPSPNSVALAVETENEQKIFEVPGTPVAYTIRGDSASRNRMLNISGVLQDQIADVLHRNRDLGLYVFADTVSYALQQAIRQAKRKGIIEHYPETEVTFVGYMREQPGWIDISLRPYADEMAREVVPRYFRSGYWYLSGSRIIAGLFDSRDPRVPDISGLQSETMSLDDAVTIAKAYVETCCSPLGMQVDPENCSKIGGHVHVATVCPLRHIGIREQWRRAFSGPNEVTDGGFRWLIPPQAESH